MTDNTTPRCERCGTQMTMPSGLGGLMCCPLPESACAVIAALRSKCEGLEKRNEELWLANGDMTTAIGHLSAEFGHPCLEGSDSLAMLVVKYALDRMAETESRAQEAETKLRAAEDQVVVLREALETAVLQNDHDMLLTGDELREMALTLSNTSAAVQEAVKRVEREALAKAWERVEAARLSERRVTVDDLDMVEIRAAILGEKGGDDGSV